MTELPAGLRVVIAEDLVLLREGVAKMLTSYGIEVLAQVGEPAGLLRAVREHQPDLAIIDVRMPPTFTDEGARAALQLHAEFPRLAIMMLSNVVEPGLAMRLVTEHPARFGYLLKDRVLDLDDFLRSLHRIANGGTAIDPEIVHRLFGAAGHSRLGELTTREREVLALLAEGLSNAAIARKIMVSERTVDAHLRSIFVKLDLHQSPDENRRVRAALAWLSAEAEGG
jgi:DNA-binding NarL/FixJ family response regulator